MDWRWLFPFSSETMSLFPAFGSPMQGRWSSRQGPRFVRLEAPFPVVLPEAGEVLAVVEPHANRLVHSGSDVEHGGIPKRVEHRDLPGDEVPRRIYQQCLQVFPLLAIGTARRQHLLLQAAVDVFEQRLRVEVLLEVERQQFQEHDAPSERRFVRLGQILFERAEIAVHEGLEHRLTDVGVRLLPLRHGPHEHFGPSILLGVGVEKDRERDGADHGAETSQNLRQRLQPWPTSRARRRVLVHRRPSFKDYGLYQLKLWR